MARIIITETASIDQANILEDLNHKAGLHVASNFGRGSVRCSTVWRIIRRAGQGVRR
jgi:hypothetical protein